MIVVVFILGLVIGLISSTFYERKMKKKENKDKGDIIATLSNTDLVLDIMNREAALAENINNLRNTRLSICPLKHRFYNG